MNELTLQSILIGFAVVVVALLYRIETALLKLRNEVKQMKIDLIHEHRGVLK